MKERRPKMRQPRTPEQIQERERLAARFPYRATQREVMTVLTSPTLRDAGIEIRTDSKVALPTNRAYKDRRDNEYALYTDGSLRRMRP